MTKYGLFVGCITPLRYPGIEAPTIDVFSTLGIDMDILENASCCPAPGVFRSFDQPTWLAIGARNLAIAQEQNVDIMTICNGCFGSLFEVAHQLSENGEKMKQANEILGKIGRKYDGKV